MAPGVVTVMLFLAVSQCLLQVEGLCAVEGKGKLTTDVDERVFLNLPCRYRLTEIKCGGFEIRVSANQDYDKNNRLYTKAIWFSIKKDGFSWVGRTSAKLAMQYFADPSKNEAVLPKVVNMKGAPFSIDWNKDKNDHSITASVEDAFDITYHAYDADEKSVRKENGVTVKCTDPEEIENTHYPASVCGNSTDKRAIRNRKKALSLTSKSMVLLYDMLNSLHVSQHNAFCEAARITFLHCSSNKSEAIKACADILINSDLRRCQREFGEKPMDAFVSCLEYMCKNDAETCEAMKTKLTGCSDKVTVPECPNVTAP